MRLNPVLDSFYTLGSLWVTLTGSHVCTSNPLPVLPAVHGAVQTSESEAPADVTAFVEVTVVPMDTERVLPNQTVVVQGGRITALGPTSQVKVPAGAVRVNGRGKYLVPGLASMHTHGFPSGANYRFAHVAAGVTSVRSLNGVDVAERQQWKDSIAAEVPGPRMYFAPQISMKTMPDSIDVSVAAAKAMGYDHIGTPYHLKAQVHEMRLIFDSLVSAARRVGLPVASHIDFLPFDVMLALGATGGSAEHLYTFLDTLGYPWPTRDSLGVQKAPTSVPDVSVSELGARVAAAQRAGVWITPTLQCTENKWPSVTPTHIKVMRQLVKALQDAGVGLLLGADDGWDVHDELAALVRAGLTPYQALLTGTRNPAAFYKLLDSTGTVTVGKRADLVLLSGNPLQDIRHTREPAGVMLNGRWFDRNALDQRLLASPKAWIEAAMDVPSILYPLAKEQRSRLGERVRMFAALTDSLTVAKPKSSEYEHGLRLLADELGVMRTFLTPEQYAIFDPIARVWLREQARQGYSVVVPGVTLGS